MNKLSLSDTKCSECGEPMVREWLGYWFPPRHASCRLYAQAVATNPERFGLPAPEKEGGS